MRSSVFELAAACAVHATDAKEVGDLAIGVDVMGDVAIEGIAGAAGRAVRLIWSARIMLYRSDASSGITFLSLMSRKGFSITCKFSKTFVFFFLCALGSGDQFWGLMLPGVVV